MAVYSVFLALGLEISVRPILDKGADHSDNDFRRDDSEDDLDYVGKELSEPITTDIGDEGDTMDEVYNAFGGDQVQVNWLTQPIWDNLGLVHLTVRRLLLSQRVYR